MRLSLGMRLSDRLKFAATPSSLLTGLVSYWTLNETSGTRADSVGDNDLTDNNTVGYDTGKNGNAASFVAGNNEYLSVTASDIAAAGGDWSGAFWVYHTGQDYAAIIGTYTSNVGFGVFSRSNNTVDYYLHYSAGDRTIVNAGCTPNAFHLVYIEWVNATKTAGISIDGGELATGTTTGGYSQPDPAAMMIGSNLPGVVAMTGSMDELAFWSRVLTSDERAELYAAGAGKFYPFS